MEYQQIVPGIFRSRPNRFIAYVDTAGGTQKVHVKNTGRCQELLTDGAGVWLAPAGKPDRKTAFDLVAVQKGELLVNIDSYAPNLAAGEWLREGGLPAAAPEGQNKASATVPETTGTGRIIRACPELVRPETVYGSSRLDFYVRSAGREYFIEVKGVTLEKEGTGLFPDAPSERAIKHVEELIRARREGYGACLLFVIQMKGVLRFRPNTQTQPAFSEVLKKAQKEGVKILAYDCLVTPNTMRIADAVPIQL